MGSPEREGHCQYFVLSPEVDHREVRKVDENTDINVPRTVVKISKVKTPKVASKTTVKPPVTQRRDSTPNRKRGTVAEAKTPAPLTARSPVTPKTAPPAPLTARTPKTAPRTPKMGSPRSKGLEEDDLTASVCSGHFSVYSEISVHSRLTQLSRKSFSKRILSSKEIEEMEVMEKRRELNALMRRNQLSCRKAISAGSDLNSAGRKQSTMKLTEPKEFHFSCPPTPRSPSPVSERLVDVDDFVGQPKAEFPRFLRSSSSCSLETWKPQLTVPRGPQLQVTRRLSAPRPTSLPPDEPTTPRRHRVEVRKAAAQVERQAVKITPMAVTRSKSKMIPEEEKPVKRVSDCGGASSPFAGGALVQSRSAKSIKASFGVPSPRGMRVSFGSKTPRPCCM